MKKNEIMHEMYNHIKSYCAEKNFLSVVFYGGFADISSEKKSDIDLAIIVDSYNEHEKEYLIMYVKEIMLQNGYILDYDIPYENKVLYTIDECNEVVKKVPCFNYRYLCFEEIQKNEAYLNSHTMRMRLLTNILMTQKIVLGDSISQYEKKCLKSVVRCAYYEIGKKNVTIEELTDKLLYSKCGNTYKEYLGFSKEKHEGYLRDTIKKIVNDNSNI